MALTSIFAVFVGAGIGACLRWWLSLVLNPVFPTLPFGTLASNLIGGYLVGVAVVGLSVKSGLPPEMRLLVITGFLGGLTTFSTFSAEVVGLLERGQLGWALASAGVHLGGSLTLTWLGMLSARWWWRGAI
ncbi:MAG: fluoride efflux transporter CrcB [Proteobacteria bacterium]|nr:fluoride efflux transporter CrcB [Pseudomonadota bacterium]